jgi:hypothetical protein
MKRRRVKASTEAFEREYSADPQVHKDSLDTETSRPDAAEGASAVMVTSNPVELEKKDDDAILSEPLKYVVSAPEAIDRAEVLLNKVKEARPDLADQVDQLLDGVESLEHSAVGVSQPEPAEAAIAPTPVPQPTPNQAQPAVQPQPEGMPAPGDRVKAKTKDGEFSGVVEDVNEDGTLEILTDKNMKLSHVPVDSVEKEKEEAPGTMSLPAGVQSSRRRNVRKSTRVKASPEKEMGAGRTPAAGDKPAAGMSTDPRAEMAVKAARQQFMAGMLNLELMAAYHPAAQEEVKRLLTDKSLKFAASAFDKLESLDLGGGYTAKRGEGDKEEGVKTVVVMDKDGKKVATYPDAFGDDTVTIIKLFRQLHDITTSDDKKAAKAEGGESASEKPKALPKTKDKKEKSDEEKDLEAAQQKFEQRLEVVRSIVADRVQKRYVVAQQDDIDAHLLKGMGLEASMNEALKASVDRELMRLLALPDTELLSIRASLGGLKPRPIEVETKVSNEGLTMMAGLQVYAEHAPDDGLDISGAFGSSFRRG